MNMTQLLKHFGNDLKSQIRTSIPAQVESFDSNKGTVNVKPLIQGIRIGDSRKVKLDTGEVVVVDDYSMPSILNVPVEMIMFGNGKITFPIKQGLQGMLCVCDRDIRLFKENEAESVQASLRKFNLNDATFRPFLPKKGEFANYNNDAIEIAYANSLIKLDNSSIDLSHNDTLIKVADGGVDIMGDVKITGNLIITEEATIGGKPYTVHTHSYSPGPLPPTNTAPPT